ncbi:hypothetical protein J1605_008735 [Eschrichtius robustus]|uniref:Uncharacterized protein n=1 Tax=Eschrichtius robustus TaxID=9764 RepID=A0AB34GT65_ESCRO|nr:hypothetical protein J1605_008735 [Eschrichtius robustus]
MTSFLVVVEGQASWESCPTAIKRIQPPEGISIKNSPASSPFPMTQPAGTPESSQDVARCAWEPSAPGEPVCYRCALSSPRPGGQKRLPLSLNMGQPIRDRVAREPPRSPRPRASLVMQWLRIRLPMQGTRVRALVQEDPTCRRATKPRAPQLLSLRSRAHEAQLLKPTCHAY